MPMLIMPSGDDPDHTPVKEVLDKKPFGDKCEYRRFDDMHHGFCAARYIALAPVNCLSSPILTVGLLISRYSVIR